MDPGRQSDEKGGHFGCLKVMENYRSCGGAGRASSSDSGRARSKPFAHAPVFRMTLVGKAQLPQTTTTATTANNNNNNSNTNGNDDDKQIIVIVVGVAVAVV